MHVVFDLDGVLLDSETDLGWLERALDAALDELGVPANGSTREALFPPTVEGIHAVAAELDLAADRLWRVRNDHYVRGKREAMESGELEPFADVGVLYELVPRHDLHIISNSPTVVVDAFVETYGFDDLFGVRLGRQEGLEALARLKPDPHLYHQLVCRLGSATPDVYVGDTATDREFADSTGMRYVHLTRDERGLATLAALPERLE